jgi:hypothetical protein
LSTTPVITPLSGIFCIGRQWNLLPVTKIMHRKKRFTSFPSPAGMSLTKLPLGRNNSVLTSLFPPRESLVGSDFPAGDEKLSNLFFYGVAKFFCLC